MTSGSLSYVHGACAEPLLGLTVGACLDRAAVQHGDRLALRVPYQQVSLSYQALQSRVVEHAAGLIALGLEPGDRIALLSPNRYKWVVAQLAAAKAGLVLVSLNPAYRKAELADALNTVQCRALISVARFKSSDYAALLAGFCGAIPDESQPRGGAQVPLLEHLIDLDGGLPGAVRFDALPSLAGATHRDRVETLQREIQFDDPVSIQFTSGTTGRPKAATLTHHNITNNAYFAGRRMALSAEDRLCVPVPMYHCFGMVLGTLCGVLHGAAIVLSSPGFDAGAVLETVAGEGCTALHGVPTMFISELDHPEFDRFDLRTLRTGIMAGAPCAPELMKRVIQEMHLSEITIAYGMTETGPVSFQTATGDPPERRVGTVGTVLPHVEVKIVDEQGRVVPRGSTGELKTRGYCVMPGYWNDPERTREALDGSGWMASGDLARIDGEGYCEIVGRVKDMLIRGGENIFPAEIEAVLFEHPKVERVEVVGVPDERLGEEVCAWIRLRQGERTTVEEIRSYCRERLAHFKVPRYVEFVDEFPLTATGKVQKFVIRERMAARLTGGEEHA